MEIKIKSGEKRDDGIFYIHSFEFLAFCLLESAEPCFESAGIELFTLDGFKEKYASMMEDVKREFSTVITASADDINSNENSSCSKGGTCDLEVNELMIKYNLSAEDIDFDMNGMDIDEVERRFANIQNEKNSRADFDGDTDNTENEDNSSEPASEDDGVNQEDNGDTDVNTDDDDDGSSNKKSKFSLTNEQFIAEIIDALYSEKYTDPYWGETNKYIYADYDSDVQEVIAYSCEDWKLYGFSVHMNGDNVNIDFGKCKRKKVCYQDFDEGDNDVSSVFKIDSLIEDLHAKFKSVSDELDSLNSQKAKFDSERESDVKNIFAKFEDLNDSDDFKKLKNDYSGYSVLQLEDKCFEIRGRNMTAEFSANNSKKPIRLPVEGKNKNASDEPYNGIFVKYGIGNR